MAGFQLLFGGISGTKGGLENGYDSCVKRWFLSDGLTAANLKNCVVYVAFSNLALNILDSAAMKVWKFDQPYSQQHTI